jgi:hypothetical protein
MMGLSKNWAEVRLLFDENNGQRFSFLPSLIVILGELSSFVDLGDRRVQLKCFKKVENTHNL